MSMIYVDTSVFGGCFEDEFSEYSIKLMEEFRRGSQLMMISEVVMKELDEARKEVENIAYAIPLRFKTVASIPLKAHMLAEKYINSGALMAKDHFDALHIATATLQGADVITSWNYKHIVNFRKIEQYNIINKEMGYRTIKIKTPREILNP